MPLVLLFDNICPEPVVLILGDDVVFPPLFGVFSVVYPCLQVLLLFVYKRQYKKL